MTAVSPKVLQHELDDAMSKHEGLDKGQVVAADPGTLERVELDEKDSRRVLRKIDWHLMPLMCLVYGLQFVSDRHLSNPRLSRCTSTRAHVGSLTRCDHLSSSGPHSAMQGRSYRYVLPGRSLCALDSVMGIRQARHIDLGEYSWRSSAFCQ
jgi:hypothetical protein